MIVGFPPGGFTDILGRQVAERLAPVFGQQIVVENRSGAAGVIGADIVAKSKPDGYTVLMGHNNSNAVAPLLYAKLPYDAQKDFAPITFMGWVATVLVVHPSVPARSVKEFVEVARRTNGKLLVASSGVGSTQHLALERFKMATGVDVIHSGTNDLSTDLGHPGELTHPDVLAAIERVAKACRAHGKHAGVGGLTGGDVMKMLAPVVKLGARFITAGTEWNLMLAAGQERVKALRALTPG